MNLLINALILSSSIYVSPRVLITYYEPFGDSETNNSEFVAKSVKNNLQKSSVEITTCKLRTVFDKAYIDQENCLKKLTSVPVMIIGLGEAGCKLKVELTSRNMDQIFERSEQVINDKAPEYLAFNYPLAKMYCSLDENQKDEVLISNNAGSFVCNNTA